MSPSINLTDESNVLPLYHLYYEPYIPNKNYLKTKNRFLLIYQNDHKAFLSNSL
jgi:hypothetical protein